MILFWITFHILVSVECVVELHTHHHHSHHKRSNLDSSFPTLRAKKNDPVLSSGDNVPNSWLYRFPPWNTQHNPPPPSLKSTTRDSLLRTKETTFLARVLTPPNTEVNNDFLDDVSLARHFPFQRAGNSGNGNFKRHIGVGNNRDASFVPSGAIQEDGGVPHLQFTTEDAITHQFSGFRAGGENGGSLLIPPNSHRGSLPTGVSFGPGRPSGLNGRALNDQVSALNPNSDPSLLLFDEANSQNFPSRNTDFGVPGREFFREPRLHQNRPITNSFPNRAQRNVIELPVGLIAPGNIIHVPKYPPLPLEDHNYLSDTFSIQNKEARAQTFDVQEQEDLPEKRRQQRNSDFFFPRDAAPTPPEIFTNVRDESIPHRRGNRQTPRPLGHGNLPLSVPSGPNTSKVSPRGLNPLANQKRTTDTVHPSSIQDIINSQEVVPSFRRNRRKRRKPRRNFPNLGFWVWSRE